MSHQDQVPQVKISARLSMRCCVLLRCQRMLAAWIIIVVCAYNCRPCFVSGHATAAETGRIEPDDANTTTSPFTPRPHATRHSVIRLSSTVVTPWPDPTAYQPSYAPRNDAEFTGLSNWCCDVRCMPFTECGFTEIFNSQARCEIIATPEKRLENISDASTLDFQSLLVKLCAEKETRFCCFATNSSWRLSVIGPRGRFR